jgi:hypothetical protein
MRRALWQLVKNMDRLEREDIRETLDKFIASTEQEQGLVTRIRRGVFGSPHSDPRWDLAWQIMRKVVPRKPRFRDHHRTQDVDETSTSPGIASSSCSAIFSTVCTSRAQFGQWSG